MQDLPHQYTVISRAGVDGEIALASEGLPELASAPPREFGGAGDRWSPETLLVAAVADCYALSFRAVARASRVEWVALECEVEGTLDRLERVMQFTRFVVRATLRIRAGTDIERARRALEKAEQACLISNSLKADKRLEARIEIEDASPTA